MQPRYIYLLFLVLISFPASAVEGEKGFVDLRQFNLHNTEVALDGEWEFYWNQLLSAEELRRGTAPPDYFWFPELWNNGKTANGQEISSQGYATYRLRVLLPDSLPPISLGINHFYSSYALYADGELVAQNGVVGTTKETSVPHWLPLNLRILPKSDTLELILHISNFHHSKGGAREPLFLGDRKVVVHNSYFDISYDLLLSGCLIMAGLFFLGLYVFGQRENYIIAFALFCLIFSYRFFGADDYVLHILYPQLPWTLTLHLEYLALFVAPALFALYSYTLFPHDSNRRVLGTFVGICALLSLITIIFPPSVFTSVIEPYLFLVVGVIGYVSYIYLSAARFNRDGARYALASTMVLFMVFIYKIYIYLALVDENRLITFIGFISFFFFQSINMFFRITRSLHKAREEAENASKAKSEFLSMMSHEIRTPLNAVIGLTNFMLLDKPKKHHEDVLDTLKFSAENLLVILNDILDFNKIEANRIEFETVPVNIAELALKLKKVFERVAREKSLDITTTIDESITKPVMGDTTRLSQILSNLISNAIKFTKKGGVEIKIEELRREGNSITLRFSVTDTGIGISQEDQQKIFESFTQASSSVTREFGGTGLGLAITRKLLNLQEVDLHLRSERGKGAEFWFVQTFEMGEEEASFVRKPDVIGESQLNRANILLVEDNKINILVAEKFLKKWGVFIDVALNGHEAVEKVKARNYDLILMDLQMPVMDGYEASKRIRELGISTPIIALTASAMMGDREKIKKFGINDHVLKPFNPKELQNKLERYLGSLVSR